MRNERGVNVRRDPGNVALDDADVVYDSVELISVFLETVPDLVDPPVIGRLPTRLRLLLESFLETIAQPRTLLLVYVGNQ